MSLWPLCVLDPLGCKGQQKRHCLTLHPIFSRQPHLSPARLPHQAGLVHRPWPSSRPRRSWTAPDRAPATLWTRSRAAPPSSRRRQQRAARARHPTRQKRDPRPTARAEVRRAGLARDAWVLGFVCDSAAAKICEGEFETGGSGGTILSIVTDA